ncbi:glycosyltransferase family 2 protein [Euryhalocaulis caribicus]|uniref:glycosyltransferase family 2 protein n=1 Tax=Euryhalocaulis caribicus TaxID=1161401 RepID=UPI0003AA2FF8|nr:glycosyltransferase family 2 protein [Euryhalocaulis caribicus]
MSRPASETPPVEDIHWACAAVLGAPLAPPRLVARLSGAAPDEVLKALAAERVFKRRVYDAIQDNATLPHDALPAITLGRARSWLTGETARPASGAETLLAALERDGFRDGLEAAGLDGESLAAGLRRRLAHPESEIRGALEVGIAGECRGWALRPGGGTIALDILIDGETLARTETGVWRPDIAAAPEGGGACGFHVFFDIPSRLLQQERLSLRVVETGTGRQIGPVHHLTGAGGLTPERMAGGAARIAPPLHAALLRGLTLTGPPDRTEASRVSIIPCGPDDSLEAALENESEAEVLPLGARLADARNETVILQAPGVRWRPGAMQWLSRAVQASGRAVFCDGQTTDKAGEASPLWKPGFDYDLLLQGALPGAAIALPRPDARIIAEEDPASDARMMETCLRFWEMRGDAAFLHLPLILSLAPESAEQPQPGARQAVEAHLARRGLLAESTPALDAFTGAALPGRLAVHWRRREAEPIRVIIPTRDKAEDLKTCIDSLRGTAAQPEALHITVIDNGSAEDATAAYLATLEGYERVRVLRDPRPFNWAALNNAGAADAVEPILVFANNDIESLTPAWDAIVRGQMQRPEIGVLGARLLYPDNRLQHAGIIRGPGGGTVHDCEGDPVDLAAPRSDLTRLDHACLGVTGAFLCCRAEDFRALEGFDEGFAVAYNDLDFCLRMKQRGLKSLYAPALTLRHAGSGTRGPDAASPEALLRGADEFSRFQSRHGEAAMTDPLANPNFTGLPPRTLVSPISEAGADQLIRPPRA